MGVRSQEELTAEMGAAFFYQIAALDMSETLQNSTAYIQFWIQHLQNNPKMGLKGQQGGPRGSGVRIDLQASGGEMGCSRLVFFIYFPS